ncbi:hypothetical protein [Caproiciproducens galactitolivorans]|uniref:Uncharacterized protein n=1 Tax=Caproiciproducens galactitolivorans TaxID=642589 RepID=A0ABT4BS68_9FIRM|nr:hypothetical protein [Caproiciproducens galactitolivorans]MCY1713724.1 hypothetical protein [Caproiciproducens galactitolivorans]
MYQQIINALVPVLITAFTGVLVAIVKAVGNAGVQLIEEKAKAVKAKAGADKYDQYMKYAWSAWNMTDENFRITPALEKTFAAKQAEFEVQIKKLIPGITDEEIEMLRQAVAGEVNKGREAIEATASDTPGNGAEVNTTPAA